MTDLTWNDPEEKPSTRYRDPERALKITNAHNTVFQMWEGGIRDLHEIEAETGYSVQYIRQILKGKGISTAAARVRTTEEVRAICADYTSGMKVKDVLRKWNITNNTLYAFLDEQQIPIRKIDPDSKRGRREFTDHAVQMYKDGFPVKDIYVETAINASVLYQELANREIPLRGHDHSSNVVTERAIQMYQENSSMNEIIAETNVSSTVLYNELRKRDIPLKRGTDTAKRLNSAVTMYQMGASVDAIYKETGVGSTMLYRALAKRGVPKRNSTGRAQGHDVDKALVLYEQGAEASAIAKASGVSIQELVVILKERPSHLRTGLSTRVTARNVEYAVQGYQQGIDFDTVEIDTLVGRPQLLAELKRRGIPVRP